VSEDPIGWRGGTNLVAYAGNNPINSTDPTGLYPSGCDLVQSAWDYVQFALILVGGADKFAGGVGIAATLSNMGCPAPSEEPNAFTTPCFITGLVITGVGTGASAISGLRGGDDLMEYSISASFLGTFGKVVTVAGVVTDIGCLIAK
jgi:hypothetical protein